ncbi:MAG: M20/M25/M40 family metallo-hydrolase [Phycisphaerales bacterium]
MNTGHTELERRVCARIAERREALLADLTLHVELPTGLGNAAALDETRDRLCARLTALGATREDIPGDERPAWLSWTRDADAAGAGFSGAAPPTAVCRRARPGLPRLLLAGHLDTVHDPLGSFRSLSVEPGGRRAVGPGCVDMKGGLVIAVAALEALESCGVACSWSFLMNSDEETGSYHSDRALRDEATRHDIGLALEPAMVDGGLAVARGGSGMFRLDAVGRAAHVGRDFASGVSAVDILARAILDAHSLSEPARGVCVNIGPLKGGLAPNVVADAASAWGNVRFPDDACARALDSALHALSGPSAHDPGRLAVHTSFNRPAKPTTPAVQQLAELARGAAEDLGQRLPFGTTAGVCDGNILQAAGLPTIDTLGVRGGGLHTPEEWIDLSSLVERCQLLAVLMCRLSAGAMAG